MLANVSWTEYAVAVVLVLILYYLLVVAKLYRKEIGDLLAGKLTIKSDLSKRSSDIDQVENVSDPSSFDELETVVNDLRYAVMDRAGKGAGKQELLALLKARLASYSGLQKPAFRVAINNYITINAQDICGVMFSEDELNRAWDTLPRR